MAFNQQKEGNVDGHNYDRTRDKKKYQHFLGNQFKEFKYFCWFINKLWSCYSLGR